MGGQIDLVGGMVGRGVNLFEGRDLLLKGL